MPTTIEAPPDAAASNARRRSAAGSWPVSRVGRSRAARSGPREATSERRCCPASTSVGARNAACPPESATVSIARSATRVLPDPTSPCTSRFIGTPDARSFSISWPTCSWSCVSWNGSDSSSSAVNRPGCRGGTPTERRSARWRSSPACSTNASWNRSASCPRFQSESDAGRCTRRSASPNGTSPRAVRTASGTGSSSAGGRLPRAISIALASCHDASVEVAG